MAATFSIRINSELRERLEKLSKSTSRSKTFHIEHALKEYIAINEWQIEEIKQAIEEADRPGAKFVDHEFLKAKWEGKRAHPLERKSKQKS
jgi:RHH-type transcriptional regulator, rel operon repressor / antitoxin RelB